MTALPTTYRKVVSWNPHGGPSWDECCKIVEVAMPALSENQVLVKILTAGVEASDLVQAHAGYGLLFGVPVPSHYDGSIQPGDMGCEAVGVVKAVGSAAAATHKVGDFVCLADFGVGFREYVAVDAPRAIKVPAPLPELVVLPISGNTAFGPIMALDRPVRKGDVVVVTAAAGAVGHVAVQLAKSVGATVIGTCSSDAKIKLLKELGCDRVIDYKKENVTEVIGREFPNGVNVVFESVGGPLREALFNVMAVQGRMWIIGSVAEDYTTSPQIVSYVKVPTLLLLLKEVQITGFFLKVHMAEVGAWSAKMVELMLSGKLRMVLDKASCSSLRGVDGVSSAETLMRKGTNVGKIYVQMADA